MNKHSYHNEIQVQFTSIDDGNYSTCLPIIAVCRDLDPYMYHLCISFSTLLIRMNDCSPFPFLSFISIFPPLPKQQYILYLLTLLYLLPNPLTNQTIRQTSLPILLHISWKYILRKLVGRYSFTSLAVYFPPRLFNAGIIYFTAKKSSKTRSTVAGGLPEVGREPFAWKSRGWAYSPTREWGVSSPSVPKSSTFFDSND